MCGVLWEEILREWWGLYVRGLIMEAVSSPPAAVQSCPGWVKLLAPPIEVRFTLTWWISNALALILYLSIFRLWFCLYGSDCSSAAPDKHGQHRTKRKVVQGVQGDRSRRCGWDQSCISSELRQGGSSLTINLTLPSTVSRWELLLSGTLCFGYNFYLFDLYTAEVIHLAGPCLWSLVPTLWIANSLTT